MASSKAAVIPSGQNSSSGNPSIPTSSSSVGIPLWMKQSLEHLSMKTNMEEYGTSPPENDSFFLHESKLPNYSMTKINQKNVVQSMSSAAGNCSSLVFQAKEWNPSRAPRSLSVAAPRTVAPQQQQQQTLTTPHGDQVCPSSAPQSAATTPSPSPQHSPTLIRKILSADISTATQNSQSKAGHFISECSRKARMVPVTRVTNFDLNAVSPTSW